MKRFSYANTYNAYLSAVLLTFCSTAALHPRDHSVCKPTNYTSLSKIEPRTFPACDAFKKCLKPLFNKQTNEIIAACQESCDQRITVSSPTTIIQPGQYCLLADLDVTDGPAITIASGVNDVVIDLNNHLVTGSTDIANGALIEVVGGSKRISILNGTVQPLGANTAGIRVQNSSDVVLSGLSLRGNNDISGEQRGILVSEVTGFNITNCAVNQIGFRPAQFNTCNEGNVKYCSLYGNAAHQTDVVTTIECVDLLFEQVNASNNQAVTFSQSAFWMLESFGVTYLECSANDNENFGQGFAMRDCFSGLFKGCEANNIVKTTEDGPGNVDGFEVTNCRYMTFDSCTSNFNRMGNPGSFRSRGFFINNCITCVVCNCLAKGNGQGLADPEGVGFQMNDGSGNYLENNIAIDNTRWGFTRFGNALAHIFVRNYAENNSLQNYIGNTGPVVNLDISTGDFDPLENLSDWANISVVPS